MKFAVGLACFIFTTAPCLADQITKENTFISNGVYAAGYADAYAQNGTGSAKMRGGLAMGWQLLRAWGNTIAAGYNVTAGQGDESLLRGPEAQILLFSDAPVYAGFSFGIIDGYVKRNAIPDGQDKYIGFKGRRVEGRLAIRAVDQAQILLLGGRSDVVPEATYETEFNDGEPDRDPSGAYFGLGVRFTHL